MKHLLTTALLVAGASMLTNSFALSRADELGEPAASALADRTLHVGPDTRYLNVVRGQIATLDVNGRAVTWDFDGLASRINLRDIDPGAPSVQIYVSETPEG